MYVREAREDDPIVSGFSFEKDIQTSSGRIATIDSPDEATTNERDIREWAAVLYARHAFRLREPEDQSSHGIF